eukprot:GHVS01085937.1.p1 GENE.GHVS01085937.1~~GHVS01085937.1.p1  ORF type:complete len:562 (-),score=76.18 GHVS01085937.1:75-1511(-)
MEMFGDELTDVPTTVEGEVVKRLTLNVPWEFKGFTPVKSLLIKLYNSWRFSRRAIKVCGRVVSKFRDAADNETAGAVGGQAAETTMGVAEAKHITNMALKAGLLLPFASFRWPEKVNYLYPTALVMPEFEGATDLDDIACPRYPCIGVTNEQLVAITTVLLPPLQFLHELKVKHRFVDMENIWVVGYNPTREESQPLELMKEGVKLLLNVDAAQVDDDMEKEPYLGGSGAFSMVTQTLCRFGNAKFDDATEMHKYFSKRFCDSVLKEEDVENCHIDFFVSQAAAYSTIGMQKTAFWSVDKFEDMSPEIKRLWKFATLSVVGSSHFPFCRIQKEFDGPDMFSDDILLVLLDNARKLTDLVNGRRVDQIRGCTLDWFKDYEDLMKSHNESPSSVAIYRAKLCYSLVIHADQNEKLKHALETAVTFSLLFRPIAHHLPVQTVETGTTAASKSWKRRLESLYKRQQIDENCKKQLEEQFIFV